MKFVGNGAIGTLMNLTLNTIWAQCTFSTIDTVYPAIETVIHSIPCFPHKTQSYLSYEMRKRTKKLVSKVPIKSMYHSHSTDYAEKGQAESRLSAGRYQNK